MFWFRDKPDSWNKAFLSFGRFVPLCLFKKRDIKVKNKCLWVYNWCKFCTKGVRKSQKKSTSSIEELDKKSSEISIKIETPKPEQPDRLKKTSKLLDVDTAKSTSNIRPPQEVQTRPVFEFQPPKSISHYLLSSIASGSKPSSQFNSKFCEKFN